MITKNELNAIGIELKNKVNFNSMGMSNTKIENSLSFIDNEKFIIELNDNRNITGCITTDKLSKKITNKFIIISEDPRFDFYNLLNYVGKKNYKKTLSIIDITAQIHPKANISEYNVTIGKNTIIHPNATIMPDVIIGDDCVIGSGTVIGSEGFEYKKTSKGILSVFHDGKVIIGNKVEIGANNCIDKGFSFKNTIIENDVKIDNLIHVAHGVKIKRGAFIIAGTVLGGSTIVGENAWLGINSSIAPGIELKANAFISMGAVVTKNVEENQQVTGNFAIEHNKFIQIFKRQLKND